MPFTCTDCDQYFEGTPAWNSALLAWCDECLAGHEEAEKRMGWPQVIEGTLLTWRRHGYYDKPFFAVIPEGSWRTEDHGSGEVKLRFQPAIGPEENHGDHWMTAYDAREAAERMTWFLRHHGQATADVQVRAHCPKCGEQRPGDEKFIAEHGRCFRCNKLADEARQEAHG